LTHALDIPNCWPVRCRLETERDVEDLRGVVRLKQLEHAFEVRRARLV